MADWLVAAYPWLKTLHIIAVISWMAALLYLPRLFVYHCTVLPGSETSETFKIMERRLSKAIMNPAMTVATASGLAIVLTPGYLASTTGWIWLKLALAAILLATHYFLLTCRNAFATDTNQRPEKFYRLINELPTLLMIGIVILVVVRPF